MTQHWPVNPVKTRKNKRKFYNMIARTAAIIEDRVTFPTGYSEIATK